MVVQAKPLLESSNNSDDQQSSKNHQLYEIYKMMRADPRLASVSNEDIVLYIYRKFGSNINDDNGSSQKENNQVKTNSDN